MRSALSRAIIGRQGDRWWDRSDVRIIAQQQEDRIMDKQSKTRVEYEIRGLYADGWEMVTTEDDYTAAREQVRCYRENEPATRFRIQKVYSVLPEYEQELRETLERINTHHGNGDITQWDMDRCAAWCKKQYGSQWYTFALLDGDRVRFRGVVRKIGYVPVWAR